MSVTKKNITITFLNLLFSIKVCMYIHSLICEEETIRNIYINTFIFENKFVLQKFNFQKE